MKRVASNAYQMPLLPGFDEPDPVSHRVVPVSRQEAISKIEWSYSRRSQLERCARLYYNEYFGANKRNAKTEEAKDRLHFLKGVQTRYERTGAILHLAIANYF